jgi:hypothetical protein
VKQTFQVEGRPLTCTTLRTVTLPSPKAVNAPTPVTVTQTVEPAATREEKFETFTEIRFEQEARTKRLTVVGSARCSPKSPDPFHSPTVSGFEARGSSEPRAGYASRPTC